MTEKELNTLMREKTYPQMTAVELLAVYNYYWKQLHGRDYQDAGQPLETIKMWLNTFGYDVQRDTNGENVLRSLV